MPRTGVALPQGVLRLDVVAATDVGTVRAVNEDALLSAAPLFAVADGMGGHARGDLASSTAVRVLAEAHGPADLLPVDTVFTMVETANAAVRGLDAGGEVCGTTLTGLTLVHAGSSPDGPARWGLFNVGDSRVYRWSDDGLEQLTVDHSAVQVLVSAGILSPEEAETHPDRNIITRALGADDEVDVDLWTLPVEDRAIYVLCSDGLTKELGDDEIAAVLAERIGATDGGADAAEALVEAAVAAGGRDNVTVVVIEAALERHPSA